MPEPQPNEVATVGEFLRKYPGYFEELPEGEPPIDPTVVPEALRHLIPFAEQFGIWRGWARHAFCQAAPPELVAAFKQALSGSHALYEDWDYGFMFDDQPVPENVQDALNRFMYMYLAELEEFGGRGLRGFTTWYQATDPEGYAEWVAS
jgi:hypothetical protein